MRAIAAASFLCLLLIPAPAEAGPHGLIAEARRDLGKGPRQLGVPRALWCADALGVWLKRRGLPTTGSRAARSYLDYGRRVSGPRVGAIAVLSRGRRGGHVGIVTGTDARGNPILINGNDGNRVRERAYPRDRVLGYVMPPSYSAAIPLPRPDGDG